MNLLDAENWSSLKLHDPLLDSIAEKAAEKDYAIKTTRAEVTQNTKDQHASNSEDYLTANRLHQYDEIRRKLTELFASDALNKLKPKELIEKLEEELMKLALTDFTFTKEILQGEAQKNFRTIKRNIYRRKTQFTSGMSGEAKRIISIISRFLDLEKREKLIAVNSRELWSRISDPTKWWNIRYAGSNPGYSFAAHPTPTSRDPICPICGSNIEGDALTLCKNAWVHLNSCSKKQLFYGDDPISYRSQFAMYNEEAEERKLLMSAIDNSRGTAFVYVVLKNEVPAYVGHSDMQTVTSFEWIDANDVPKTILQRFQNHRQHKNSGVTALSDAETDYVDIVFPGQNVARTVAKAMEAVYQWEINPKHATMRRLELIQQGEIILGLTNEEFIKASLFKLHEQLRVGLRHKEYFKNEPEESIKNRKSFHNARVRLSAKNPSVRKDYKKSL